MSTRRLATAASMPVQPLLPLDHLRRGLAKAISNPFAMQAALLDALMASKMWEAYVALSLTLSTRNEIAAHQLVAACLRAKLFQA